MDETLYERYGVARLTRLMTRFYAEVLDSPRLGHYFDGVHIETLVEHQAAFMSMAMGGPRSYSTEQLHDIHVRLNITDDDFSEMMRVLRRSLERFGIDPADAEAVVDRYERQRNTIVVVSS